MHKVSANVRNFLDLFSKTLRGLEYIEKNNPASMTNSDMLEELMYELWNLGIIEEVRAEVTKVLRPNMSSADIYDAYESSYKIIKKKLFEE